MTIRVKLEAECDRCGAHGIVTGAGSVFDARQKTRERWAWSVDGDKDFCVDCTQRRISPE